MTTRIEYRIAVVIDSQLTASIGRQPLSPSLSLAQTLSQSILTLKCEISSEF